MSVFQSSSFQCFHVSSSLGFPVFQFQDLGTCEAFVISYRFTCSTPAEMDHLRWKLEAGGWKLDQLLDAGSCQVNMVGECLSGCANKASSIPRPAVCATAHHNTHPRVGGTPEPGIAHKVPADSAVCLFVASCAYPPHVEGGTGERDAGFCHWPM